MSTRKGKQATRKPIPRILSLDDEPGVRDALRQVLKLAGYEHLTASDSDEALRILRSQPIDLLTQDIKRPGMDGWELCRLLKSEKCLRHVPILIISAAPKPRSRKLLAYIDGYVRKPFQVEQLFFAVERVLRKPPQPLPPRR